RAAQREGDGNVRGIDGRQVDGGAEGAGAFGHGLRSRGEGDDRGEVGFLNGEGVRRRAAQDGVGGRAESYRQRLVDIELAVVDEGAGYGAAGLACRDDQGAGRHRLVVCAAHRRAAQREWNRGIDRGGEGEVYGDAEGAS